MKILLVANHPDDAVAVQRALLDEGHDVLTCHDDRGGPCRGVTTLDACPLEDAVQMAVVARTAHTHRGLGEMGAVCAARQRVGTVEVDPEDLDEVVFSELAVQAESTVLHEYKAAIASRLAVAMPDLGPCRIDVHRVPSTVNVVVAVDHELSPQRASSLADQTRAAVRGFDRFTQVIDVSVRTPTAN
jgi:hypothetical protein